MLLLDPILSGVPATVFVDASPTALATPTATMLADTRTIFRENVAPFRWYRSNGSALVEIGSATPVSVNNLVYAGDLLTSVTISGITWSYTYDVNGNPQTVTAGGVTRTYTYDVAGNITGLN